jgi:sirohydrochlorin cobaltochelatase
MRGLILFAHGARDPAWAGPLKRLRERLRAAAPDTPAELAFLDIMTPDLPTAADRLIAGGCRSLVVVPIFFGQGGHVKQDLAALVGDVAARHPGVAIRSATAVGESDAVLDALAGYVLAAIRAEPENPAVNGEGQ